MSASAASVDAVATTRDYYNSDDADLFYSSIWGGEDIHIGIYCDPEESIPYASRRTVLHIAARLPGLSPASRVLDIGSGYAGAARYLAKAYGCRVTALNLSEVENRRARQLNEQQGLDDLVEVIDGAFENLTFADDSFDVVWSQDAILHSGDRARVFAEVSRVLKPKGEFLFTDPMQADDCPPGVLQPILDRIHLESLGAPASYRRLAARCGLTEVAYEQLTAHLVTHYSRVLTEVDKQADSLQGVSPDYLRRMKKGLQHWIDGGKRRQLEWGIFHFRKT
jgi:sarcosine/dimethylglycine N-methyltransferase